jgi:hypothetical protein
MLEELFHRKNIFVLEARPGGRQECFVQRKDVEESDERFGKTHR